MSWWYAVNNEKLGPIDQDALITLYRDKKIDAATLVWTKGMADWQAFGSIEALQASPEIVQEPVVEMTAEPVEQPPVAIKPSPIMTGEPARTAAPKESSSRRALLYVLLGCVVVLFIAYGFMTWTTPGNSSGNSSPLSSSPAPAQKVPANSVVWTNPVTNVQAHIDRSWIFKDKSKGQIADFSFDDKDDAASLFIDSEPGKGRSLEQFLVDFKKELLTDETLKFKDGGQKMTLPTGMPTGSRGWQLQAITKDTKFQYVLDINIVQIGNVFWILDGVYYTNITAEKKVMLDILRLRVLKTLK